jgi:hypothetical protein
MDQGKEQQIALAVGEWIDRHWRLLVVLVWLGFCAWFVYNRWTAIHIFALPDTDDNMRMSQVRGLLSGQGWFDLRQHRLNPPYGANIHWSRLVDLPIAGLILLRRPIIGGPHAEQWAAGIAPLLPYLLLLVSLSLVVRRLIDRRAFPLAFVALFFAGSTNGMFMPMRIDHHGWQLALLALAIAGIADPKRARGGATLGIASALSLTIGLEMLIYLAIAGAAQVLFWVADPDERRRLAAYAATLAGGTAIGFVLFASYANRLAVCDALSPVWLSDAMLGGALMVGLAMLPVADWKRRLALAVLAGAVIAAFHALMWPQCLSRLEGVSPEVERLWLSHVREARPVYRNGWRVASVIAALPVTGLIGWTLLAITARRDGDRLRRVIACLLPSFAATFLLLWQTRTGPAAQMLAVPGAVAIVWILVPMFAESKSILLRTAGVFLAAIVGAGAAIPLITDYLPKEAPSKREIRINRANAACVSMTALRPVAHLPRGMVFTFVDYGPRIITVTHHDAVAGPYHRNGQQIADVMNAFRGSAEQAHRLIAKYRSNYLLICPDSSTSTIFMAETPKGFYSQLQKGEVPGWLQPVELPKNSPFKLWKVVG